MDIRPIGVFDSGTGGISLLRCMRRLLPAEDFVYYGDDANAPYGTKPEGEIIDLVRADVDFLLRFNVKTIVIACNTATSAAAKALRAELTMPVIGIEPALKPAALGRKNGSILVLATPATLRQKKFADLMALYGEHAIPLPCPGLMEFAERGEIESEALDSFLDDALKCVRGIELDGVVLGCTHYSFLTKAVRKALPGVTVYDGNEGTARQLKRVLEANALDKNEGAGSVSFYTSGDADTVLPIMRKLYALPID